MRIIPYLLLSFALSCKEPIINPPPSNDPSPNLSQPEVESEQYYSGRIDGLFAIYTKGKKDCSLFLSSGMPIGTIETRLIDTGCDGKVDSVLSLQDGITFQLEYKNINTGEIMKRTRETSYEGYLKFKRACALTVKNKGSGYLVDLGCDDVVDYVVSEMPRSGFDASFASEFDSLLERGSALTRPENRYALELEQLLDLFSIESLRTME